MDEINTLDSKGLKLSKPPIREALIDIRANVDASTLPKPEELEASLKNSVGDKYPVVKRRQVLTGIIQANEKEVPRFTNSGLNGFILQSEDGITLFQARVDGFTLNKLQPYSSFPKFIGEAKELWNVYRSYFNPSTITRAALRYINDIKLDNQRLSQIFTAIHPLSGTLSGKLNNYSLTLTAHSEDERHQTNVVIHPAPQNKTGEAAYVLDIDVFCNYSQSPSDAQLWQDFDYLRRWKNQIFREALEKDILNRYR